MNKIPGDDGDGESKRQSNGMNRTFEPLVCYMKAAEVWGGRSRYAGC